MRLGTIVEFAPTGMGRGKKVRGRVVWVHPQRRFADVAYRIKTPLGGVSPVMRESFKIINGWLALD